jgi:hypothetical protein
METGGQDGQAASVVSEVPESPHPGGRHHAAGRFKARARTSTPAEKPALWKTMVAIWPAYDEYQKRTTREIPLVIIERD